MRHFFARFCAPLLAFGAAITVAASAKAGSGDNDRAIFIVATSVPGAASTVFMAYHIVTAAKGEQPSRTWATAEVAVMALPTLVYPMLLIGVDYFVVEYDPRGVLAIPLLMLGSTGTAMLMTHGIWSLATTRTPPGVVIGGSLAIGADVSMTSLALASAFLGRLPDRVAGISQVVLTVPQLVAGSYALATSPADRGLWITVTAWSGALFVHGFVSAIKGKLHEVVRYYLPPPETPEKPPLMVPASLQLSPMMVSDGRALAPGLGIRGVF